MTETLDDNYARAGYHARQSWGRRPALLLVDFARAYFAPDSPLYGGEGCAAARDHAVRLLARARATGTPVIFTEVRYLPGGRDGGVFYRKATPLKVLEWGNPLGDLVDGMDRRPDEVMVTKQYPSAFFGTSLAATLTAMGVDTVLLTGLTTSGCVRATCVDAMSHGLSRWSCPTPSVTAPKSPTAPTCSTCPRNTPIWSQRPRPKPISLR